jgi:hypothetical protein
MLKSSGSSLALSLCILFSFSHTAHAQATVPPPGQPPQTTYLDGFETVGNSIVSAQQVCALYPRSTLPNIIDPDTPRNRLPQLFLGTADKVYIVDKVENNPTQINGHPAWAAGEFPHDNHLKSPFSD